MMNAAYEVATSDREIFGNVVNIRSIYFADSQTEIATFNVPMGDAAFEAVKHQIARDGGTLFDLDTGEYLAGSLDQLTREPI